MVNIDNCRFENNSAGWNGGAIDCEGTSYHTESRLNLTNSVFIGNSASHDGGAVTSYYSITTIKNCEFYNNTAGRDGGAIRVKFCQYHLIDNSTFMYNKAIGGNGWGAAIYTWSDVESYITNCYIAFNVADEAGGGITSASRVHIFNCTIVNNTATEMGGGIYIYEEGEGVYSTAIVNDNIIYDNKVVKLYLAENGGCDVFISPVVTEGNLLNFNDNYWGVNDPLNATDYPYAWSKRFMTNNRTVIMVSWLYLKESTNLVCESFSMYYHNGTKYIVKLVDDNGNPLANQKITILINGQNVSYQTDSNGLCSMNINLIPGKYPITAIYEGNEQYKCVNITTVVNVLSTIKASNMTKYFQNETQFTAIILDGIGKAIANKTVSMNINGIIYKRTAATDGSFMLPINLGVGKYVLTVTNPVDDLFMSYNIEVLSLLKADNLIKYFKNDSQFIVKVLDKQGNAFPKAQTSFNINGIFYNRISNDSGLLKIDINLPPGLYIITGIFDDFITSFNIEVLITIVSENIEMTVENRIPFTVSVSNSHGKAASGVKISFNVNGIIYYRTTTEEGFASLPINLPEGKYIITSIFDQLAISNTITVTK